MAASLGFSQTPQTGPGFEVASVKTVNPDNPDPLPRNLPPAAEERLRFQGGPGTDDPGRIRYSGVTMRMLLRRAYGLKLEQIAGSAWIDEQRYEIIANLRPGTDQQQLQLMLHSLLTERFQIQSHREKKMMPIYALVAAKDGPKLQPPEEPQPPGEPKTAAAIMEEQQKTMAARMAARDPNDRGHTRYHAAHASMDDLINFLSIDVDQPVFDRTGLKGEFAMTLSYYRRIPDASPGPSVFEAVKTQLGLELVPRKEEVEILVIDRANRVPNGN